MTEALDLPGFERVASLPEITLDVYKNLPEDVCTRIEVVDGWMVRCESPEPSHQTIARNLANHLWAAVKELDRRQGTCHRVNNDLDVLLARAPSSTSVGRMSSSTDALTPIAASGAASPTPRTACS